MATDNSTAGSTPPPDPSNLRAQLTDALAQADAEAAGRVRQLQWMQQARASQLSRTAAELKAEYGPNDAGVKRAEAALAAATAASSNLALVHQQITIPEPEVAPGGWALYGHVFTAERKPVEGFTVFLVDTAKVYQQAYGFAYTDQDGYFVLQFQGSPAAAAAGDTSPGELFIAVADLKARLVHLSTAPFQPVIGIATYHRVVLSEGARPLGEPPAGARAAGIPKRKPPR